MTQMNLPANVVAVFQEFRTCELTTLAKAGRPVTWPIEPLYLPEKGQFLITTSIGLPQKAFNIRRDPRVSLFFSTPTGSGLVDPPKVLVQGNAIVSEKVLTTFKEDLQKFGILAFERQPAAELYSRYALLRYLFDWYYMRLIVYVTPCRIQWWDSGDQNQVPQTMEVNDVG